MSVTVTVNTHCAVPVESRNTYLTMVSPAPKLDPDWWDCSTIETMRPSLEAVGSSQIPEAILLRSVMFSITSDGQFTMIGPGVKGAEKHISLCQCKNLAIQLSTTKVFKTARTKHVTTTIPDVHTNKMATKVPF